MYNIDEYIEVYSNYTSTYMDSYPFVDYDPNTSTLEYNHTLYHHVKQTIKNICKNENSTEYIQLFVAFKFYYWEAYEYNLFTAPPKDKCDYNNTILLLSESYSKGKEALTAIDNKNGSKIIIKTLNEHIVYIGVWTQHKTYKVPDYYYNLAEFDAEIKELSYIYNTSRGEYEQEEVKAWVRGVLKSYLTNAINGGNERNNYEERFFKRLGGLYRWLNDNKLISSTPTSNLRDATIDFIKELFNLKYADDAKIIQYITKEKGVIPKSQ